MDPLPDGAVPEPAPGVAAADRAAVEVVVLLVVSNVVANRILDAQWYIPWNLAMAAAVVALARRRGGCSLEELGLARDALGPGLRTGLAAAAGITAGVALAALVPATADFFADDRGRLTGGEVAWKVLVTIPLGTALLEEVAFRGALPPLIERNRWWTHQRALAASAGLFGLWHVLPSLRLEEQNDTLAGQGGVTTWGVVAGSVVVTALAGRGLSWLRDRSGSLVAPVLAHVAINAAGSLAAWAVAR